MINVQSNLQIYQMFRFFSVNTMSIKYFVNIIPGEYQPAMTGNFILPCFLVCSHVRAAFYWNLAFKNTDKFVGVRCDSVAKVRHGRCYDSLIETNYLGPKTNFSKPGIYYLPTTEFVPYFVEDGTKSREYGVNNYLLKTAPDKDLIVWHEIKLHNIMIAFFIHNSVTIRNKQQLFIMILLGRNIVV